MTHPISRVLSQQQHREPAGHITLGSIISPILFPSLFPGALTIAPSDQMFVLSFDTRSLEMTAAKRAGRQRESWIVYTSMTDIGRSLRSFGSR